MTPVLQTRSLCILLFTATACCVTPVLAAKFKISRPPTPGVMLTIGKVGTKIDEVAFKITAGELGNGIPVRGKPDIKIRVANRATPNNSRVAVLTVDSSIPLRNVAHNTPFTSISWVSKRGVIPSGRFDGSSSQYLFSFSNSQEIRDTHRFFYDNATVLEAGAYTGRVTYTLAMP